MYTFLIITLKLVYKKKLVMRGAMIHHTLHTISINIWDLNWNKMRRLISMSVWISIVSGSIVLVSRTTISRISVLIILVSVSISSSYVLRFHWFCVNTFLTGNKPKGWNEIDNEIDNGCKVGFLKILNGRGL